MHLPMPDAPRPTTCGTCQEPVTRSASQSLSTGSGLQMDHFVDRRSKSLWMDVAVTPNATPLRGGQECDVVIIGAGRARISTAYELAIEGLRLIVLDRGKIGGGITARTTARRHHPAEYEQDRGLS